MPDLVRRPFLRLSLRLPIALIGAALLASILLAPGASAAPATDPAGIDAFMKAIGQVESSGRYTAVNPVSGAYGKYQIMPANWAVWARTHLGDASAPQTPDNQEKVARGRMIVLYRWLGTWPRVAYWWLTGSSAPIEQWTNYGRRYVDKVMTLAGGLGWPPSGASSGAAPQGGTATTTPTAATAPTPAPLHLSETASAITYAGSWGSASHAGSTGGTVAWATEAGAAAQISFTGRTFSWVGPVGPTRGTAQVWVDGQLAANVTEYAGGYSPQKVLYLRDFGVGGRHTVRIVVAGTAGHPMVAIDDLVIGF